MSKGLKTILLLATLLVFSSCLKQSRENPYTPEYYLGKWKITEMIHVSYVGNTPEEKEIQNVKGSIHFKGGLTSEFSYKAPYKVSYTNLFGEKVSFQDELNWRVEGPGLIMTTEAEYNDPNNIPMLGFGSEHYSFWSPIASKAKDKYVVLRMFVGEETGDYASRILIRLER